MKILKFNFIAISLASIALLNCCKKDSTETVSPFVGNYVISHAETAEVISVNTVGAGTLSVPVGTDITPAIQTALLSSVNCTSLDKSWVELRKDKSLYLSCEGANELNAGTWEEVDAATLKLNMNSAAIPTSASGFVLTVSNIVTSATGLSGKTSVPLPKEMIAAMIPYPLDPATPAIIMVVLKIDFTKK